MVSSKYKELKELIKENNKEYFLIEGMKLFNEAVKSSLKIEKIYIDEKNITLLSKICPDYKNSNVDYIDNSLLAKAYTTTSDPDKEDLILAFAKIPQIDLDDVLKSKKNIVFLEHIQDPGNLGVIIRSSLAFNAGGVCITEGSVNPFNTKAIRSSAGALFNMPVITVKNVDEFLNEAKKQGYGIVATSLNATTALSDLRLSGPTMFMFGNEGSGLSKELLNKACKLIKIPQSQKVESLNLGVAVSVMLWEASGKHLIN